MDHPIATSIEVNEDVVLNVPHPLENLSISPTLTLGQAKGSQPPNGCSVPKSIEKTAENNTNENDTDEAYAERRQRCMLDLETHTGKALKLTYHKEYKTWSNSKNRSKK